MKLFVCTCVPPLATVLVLKVFFVIVTDDKGRFLFLYLDFKGLTATFSTLYVVKIITSLQFMFVVSCHVLDVYMSR